VPAAAVIPAPIAYIKVVAVKKLVVGFLVETASPTPRGVVCAFSVLFLTIIGFGVFYFFMEFKISPSVTVSKSKCSKQAFLFKSH
jgi:hypothetical protein